MRASVETERLRLRRCVEDDLDVYCRRIYADADVMRTLPGGQPVPLDEARPRARNYLIDHWERHGFGPWLVERLDNRRIIGHCGLRYWPNTEDVEVLYGFEPASRDTHPLYAFDESAGDLHLEALLSFDDGRLARIERVLQATGKSRTSGADDIEYLESFI